MAANIPLPAGWEAKFDTGQQRYFFINHHTQKTTWEDPRLALMREQKNHQNRQWPQASPQVQPRSVQASPRIPHASSHSPRAGRSHENIAMEDVHKPKWQKDIENEFDIKVNTMGHADDEDETTAVSHDETSFSNVDTEKLERLKRMFPTAEEWAVRNALAKSNNVEGITIAKLQKDGYHRQNIHSQLKETNIVNKLQREFPTAEMGIIRDVVQCVDQNEVRSRQELKALGYKQVMHEPTPTQPSPISSPSRVTPVKKTSHVQPRKSESPARTQEMSEEAKRAVKTALQSEFKEYSDSMIQIALDSCQYNKERARALLQSMMEQRKKELERKKSNERSLSPTPKSGSSSSSRTATTTLPSVNFTLPDFKISAPKASTTSTGSSKKTTLTTSKAAISKHKAKPKAKSAGHVQNRTASVPAKHKSINFVSANKTAPNGPDSSLALGPDKQLLIQYIEENDEYMGPDPWLICGPNWEQLCGTGLATGPDRSFRSGPDRSLRFGADPELLGGTMYGYKPPAVTVL